MVKKVIRKIFLPRMIPDIQYFLVIHVMSLYIYIDMIVDLQLNYECLGLDSELSTCYFSYLYPCCEIF